MYYLYHTKNKIKKLGTNYKKNHIYLYERYIKKRATRTY